MRRWIIPVLAGMGLFACVSFTALAQTFPRPDGFVSDFAGVMDPADKITLENRLVQLSWDTGAEVAVVTIVSLNGDTIEDYAVQLFEQWGIGKKDADNGVLFIVAIGDQAVRIEVGYGLEPIITDARAGRILDNDVLPAFRQGDYSAGIVAGAASIESLVRANSPPSFIEENPFTDLLKDKGTLFTGLGIATIYMISWMARTRSIWLGGVWGAIVGVILGLATGNTWALVGLAIVLALFGLFLDAILSGNYQSRSSRGMPTGWFASGGGFRGNSGGSSFGGFGGGSSGGGGASRHW
jgi:uncharacterized protein